MIGLRGVARCRADALVLDVKALCGRQVFLRGVAPKLTTHLHMQVFSEGFSETVCQSLHHDVVVVVAIGKELLAKFVLLETSRACETSNVVLNSTLLWCNKVRHRDEVALLHIKLLTQHHKSALLLGWVLWVHHCNVITVDSVCRVESNNASRLNQVFIDELSHHDLGIVEKFLGLNSDSLVIENLRVCSIGVLSSDLPS